jgi:hypothetical protein
VDVGAHASSVSLRRHNGIFRIGFDVAVAIFYYPAMI